MTVVYDVIIRVQGSEIARNTLTIRNGAGSSRVGFFGERLETGRHEEQHSLIAGPQFINNTAPLKTGTARFNYTDGDGTHVIRVDF